MGRSEECPGGHRPRKIVANSTAKSSPDDEQSSIATVAPRLSLMLHEAASKPDTSKLARLMREYVIPLYSLRSRRKGYEVSVMKEMMNQIGLAAGPVRPPLPPLRSEEQTEFGKMLENWKPLLRQE
jgi:5-dehydro-4-deoxyglucarate dehydratase